jgi:hypothetical protein
MKGRFGRGESKKRPERAAARRNVGEFLGRGKDDNRVMGGFRCGTARGGGGEGEGEGDGSQKRMSGCDKDKGKRRGRGGGRVSEREKVGLLKEKGDRARGPPRCQ